MSISRLHPLTRGGRGGVERVSPHSAPSTGQGLGGLIFPTKFIVSCPELVYILNFFPRHSLALSVPINWKVILISTIYTFWGNPQTLTITTQSTSSQTYGEKVSVRVREILRFVFRVKAEEG